MKSQDEIIQQLGHTRTVQDVQRAYQLIFDAEQRFQLAKSRAKVNAEKKKAEIEVFLDDMKAITGLTFESPLFWKIVGLTLNIRLRRHAIASDEAYFHSPLQEGFDDGPMGNLP